MQVSVIVPTFRRPAALSSTLRALSALNFPPGRYETIVIDDAADEATRELVEETARSAVPDIRYFAQPNSGVATARNRGAQLARGDVLIFLDDDMLVEPNHIRRHLAARASHGDCVVNGHWDFAPEVKKALTATPFGRFRIEVEDWVREGIAKRPLDDGRVMPAAVTACNMSIDRRRFLELGGFDESFPFAGFEDYEFSHRAADAGCRFIYDAEIHLLHNDNRLTLQEFCERQRRGALTAVYLASRRPEEYAGQPLMTENAPISRNDVPRVAAKKLIKKALSTRPMLAVANAVIGLMERVSPEAPMLRRAYWSMCGVYIFKGVREGLQVSSLGDGSIPPPSAK